MGFKSVVIDCVAIIQLDRSGAVGGDILPYMGKILPYMGKILQNDENNEFHDFNFTKD